MSSEELRMNAEDAAAPAASHHLAGPHTTLLQSLLEGLRQRSITAVRVVGPHGACDATIGCQLSPPDSWLRYDSLLLIGGGVGVSLGGFWSRRLCSVLALPPACMAG